MTRKPMWSAEAIKAYESGQGVELVNIPHPHYKPLPEDLKPESLETVEIDLPDPWSPVSIGVDVTEAGAHVIGIYAMSDDTSQIFYSKFYPAPQRNPLSENEIKHLWYEACQTNLELTSQLIVHLARNIEAAHGIKGEA